MTNLEYIRSMNIVELASFISSIDHTTDYDFDDYDPNIYKWLESERDEVK